VHHNEYETVVVLRPDLDDAQTYGIVEKLEKIIADNGGYLLDRDDWGKRKLAYPIAKHLKGHYVLLNHLAPAPVIAMVERHARIDDSVIRFMTVKMAGAVDVDLRVAQAEAERKKRDEERARRQAEMEEQEEAQSDN
jgi:small subunit ribosomal protein S6